MSKKVKVTSVDFDFGVDGIVPSTQESYHHGEFDEAVRKTEKESLTALKVPLVLIWTLDWRVVNNFQAMEKCSSLSCNISHRKTSIGGVMWIIWQRQFLIY